MTMNKILIIGNLGSDPEMRYTPNGNPVTSFTVATNRRYRTGDGENREETEWFRISAWNRLAETCNQYLQRGSKVYVEGRWSSRTYVGNDGETRAAPHGRTRIRAQKSRRWRTRQRPINEVINYESMMDNNSLMYSNILKYA